MSGSYLEHLAVLRGGRRRGRAHRRAGRARGWTSLAVGWPASMEQQPQAQGWPGGVSTVGATGGRWPDTADAGAGSNSGVDAGAGSGADANSLRHRSRCRRWRLHRGAGRPPGRLARQALRRNSQRGQLLRGHGLCRRLLAHTTATAA